MSELKEPPSKATKRRAELVPTDTSASHRTSWEKAQATADVLSKVLVPVMLGVVGLILNNALKEKDVGVQMVQLAVSILKVDPAKGDTRQPTELRDWAIRVIDHYSEVPLREAAKELRTSPLRTGSTSLSVEVHARTVDSAGNVVHGLQVLCAPRYRRDLGTVLGLSSPAAGVLYRGLYQCWAHDPKSNSEGPVVVVDLFSQEVEPVLIDIPATASRVERGVR